MVRKKEKTTPTPRRARRGGAAFRIGPDIDGPSITSPIGATSIWFVALWCLTRTETIPTRKHFYSVRSDADQVISILMILREMLAAKSITLARDDSGR